MNGEMEVLEVRSLLVLMVLLLGVSGASAQMMGQGYGPGMMLYYNETNATTQGYPYGGMMGPGMMQGYGYPYGGMMGGYGYAPGYGMMGPGMMGGYGGMMGGYGGMMGPGMMQGYGYPYGGMMGGYGGMMGGYGGMMGGYGMPYYGYSSWLGMLIWVVVTAVLVVVAYFLGKRGRVGG